MPSGGYRSHPAAQHLEGKTVLLVEDDEDIRKMYSTVLEAVGATVLAAATLEQAGAFSASEPIDAVIVDWHLGDGSAADLISDLESIRPYLVDRLLVVSGDPRVVGSAARASLGGVSRLAKPFRPVDLIIALSEIMRRSVRS